jgi:hypothetical protein
VGRATLRRKLSKPQMGLGLGLKAVKEKTESYRYKQYSQTELNLFVVLYSTVGMSHQKGTELHILHSESFWIGWPTFC